MIADTVKAWKVEFTDKTGETLLGTVSIEAISMEEAYKKAQAYESIATPDNWTFSYLHLDTVVNIGHGLEGLY